MVSALRIRWIPARLGNRDVATIMAILGITAITRGLDYLIGHDEKTAAAGYLTSIMPLHVWAASLIAGGLVLGSGWWTQRHFLVWLGHALLAILYSALSASLLGYYFKQANWDGIRNATSLLVPATLHWTLTVRTGPRPKEPS